METLKNFTRRRSVNFFKEDCSMPKEALRNIVNLAGLAPSSSNTQPWELVVVEDPQAKENLRESAFDQPKITESSCTLIVLADPEAYKKENPTYESFVERGYMEAEEMEDYTEMVEGLYTNLEKPDRYAVKNAAFFGMSLMYAAEAYGWQSHPMIGFNPQEVKEKFEIPEDLIVTMLLSLGKFDDENTLLQRNRRKNFTDIVSMNSYNPPEKLELENPFVEQIKSVKMGDDNLNLIGVQPEVGEPVPDFELMKVPGQTITLAELLDGPVVISSVPSLDTPVCQQQTKKFSKKLKNYDEKINFVTVSCDTPFAQQRFKEKEGIDWPIYSDINGRQFSSRCGLLIEGVGLTARAVMVVDQAGVLQYFQLVEEVGEEPDYQDVENFLNENQLTDS